MELFEFHRVWVIAVGLILSGCSWVMPWPARYLAQATGVATQDQVAQQLDSPQIERSLEDGGAVWEYRYTGVSSPMLLPITEAWCIEYKLLFDPQKVLRYWSRKDCDQPLDLNSASANDLKTLPGLRGLDVSRILAGRPYQSPDELLQREIVPQTTWEVIKDRISARPP
ncbi:MAG TPA: hypothetical protein VJM82_05195 [Nitrospiraceae bacterium]|nr:hypothetical protein [Nitrospiraceae bacterium]